VTREELEEGLRHLGAYQHCRHDSPYAAAALPTWLTRHAEELLALAEGARWRSVVDESPPDGKRCQVWRVAVHRGGIPIEMLVDDATHWRWAWNQQGVTHWRPLPEPPEKP
jgi:hypothetical protein